MTQYNTLKVKFSNLQLNKLKSGIKKWYSSNYKSFIKCVVNLMMRLIFLINYY